ncbi:MAG: lipoyl(octanoyl) transferase LipB [Candidatus Omnitrophica bacterium]|nr:lipoyl(octanoyl) transferase LipB [Candidatus Omnitrophota bacterium]MCM8799003.1 lipoyl(octanoyl) transferase LipB [Candidatus Omnitrophota bacterium]
MKIIFIDLSLKRFEEVQSFQENILRKKKDGFGDDVILCSQFYPVITLGRNAKIEDILIDEETLKKERISLFKTNRGGGVTLHLPGQWVIYPIFDLANWKKDIKFFLSLLGNWIIKFLSLYNLKAEFDEKLPGVYIEERKICFLGIGISKWITLHGLSININPPLNYFSYINPCGIVKLKVTSLKEELKNLPPEEDLKENLLKALENEIKNRGFSYEIVNTSPLVSQALL